MPFYRSLTNESAIDTLQQDVEDVVDSVATNTANIATNTANIATNTANIATNTANIATNTANIANIIRVGTGVISGGLISINANNTKFDISSGTGIHIDLNTNAQTNVQWSTQTGLTPTYLLTHLISWVAIDVNGTVVQKSSAFNAEENRDLIILGVLVHVNKTNIDAVNDQHRPGDHAVNQLHDLMDSLGFLNITGNEFSAYSTNLQMKKSVGTIFRTGSNYYNDTHNPHVLTLSALNPLVMQYRLANGNNHTGLSQTTIIPTLYESSIGTTSSLTASNPFSIQRIYVFSSNNIKIQFGQAAYKTIADAIAAISTESFTTEPSILSNGLLRSYLVISKDCTNLSDTTLARFYHAGKFGGSTSGGVGGVTTMQQAYENSGASTQITTNLANGSVKIQQGSQGGTDTDLIVFKNSSATTRARITESGSAYLGKTYIESGYHFTTDYANTNITTPNSIHILLRSDGYRVECFNNGANTALALVSPDNIKMYANGVQRFHMQDTGDYISFAGKDGASRLQVQAAANVSYQTLDMNSNDITTVNTIYASYGSVTAPALRFTSNTNTGIYGAASQVNIAGAGTQLMNFNGQTNTNTSYKTLSMNSNDITTVNTIYASYGTVTAPALRFTSSTNTGIYGAASQVNIAGAGAQLMNFSGQTSINTSFVPIRVVDGSLAAPSISFTNATGTGLSLDTSDRLVIGCAGNRRIVCDDGDNIYLQTGAGTATTRLQITNTANINEVPIYIQDGTSSVPSLAFESDTDMGIFKNSTAMCMMASSTAGVLIDGGAFRRITNGAVLNCGSSGSAERWETVFATNVGISTSDERFKKDITPLGLGLSFVNELEPVTYVWKDTYHNGENGEKIATTHTRSHVGLIAQQVLSSMGNYGYNMDNADIVSNEHFVNPAKEDFYSMRYSTLIPCLINAIKELTLKVETLEARIART